MLGWLIPTYMWIFFCRKTSKEVRGDNPCAAVGEQKIFQEKDGRLKSLLKKSYLKHWVGNIDLERNNTAVHHEGSSSRRQNNQKMDFARSRTDYFLYHYVNFYHICLINIVQRLLKGT